MGESAEKIERGVWLRELLAVIPIMLERRLRQREGSNQGSQTPKSVALAPCGTWNCPLKCS